MTTYTVAASAPGVAYVVTEARGAWRCTCPDATYRKHECKHIRKVQAMTSDTTIQAPTPALPSTPTDAERRFWTRYGWPLLERALGSFPRPTTVEGWISVAESVRDLLATPASAPPAPVEPQAMSRMAEALERMAEAMERAPMATNGAGAQVQAGPPICEFHGAMKESTAKPGTFFCPKRMGNGEYCKSRG